MARFYIQSAQYANGPEEVAFLVIDREGCGPILHVTTSEDYAKELVAILNAGLQTRQG